MQGGKNESEIFVVERIRMPKLPLNEASKFKNKIGRSREGSTDKNSVETKRKGAKRYNNSFMSERNKI